MKYFAALTLAAAAATGIQLASGAGISCVQCLDGDGRRAECTGSNESEGECGEHVIGCMEEILTDKTSNKTVTMRFCLEQSNSKHPLTSSHFAPKLADSLKVEADEMKAKGCLRWNTDKYQIDIFACDTPNCNRDLSQTDCAHVCPQENRIQRSAQTTEPRDEYVASRCWECVTEHGVPTLCNDNNMNVTECAPHVIGCVENVIESRSGDLKHEMRYCMDPKRNATDPPPAETPAATAYDDEIYAKGCMQYYNEQYTVDFCICDGDECNKDCDCQYECENTDNTPAPETTTTTQGGGAGAVAAVPALTALFAVVSKILI